MALILKFLDLALLVFPLIAEWIQKKREDGESAKAYVKKQDEERLKTFEAIDKGGMEATRLTRFRMRVAKRVREEAANKARSLQTK